MSFYYKASIKIFIVEELSRNLAELRFRNPDDAQHYWFAILETLQENLPMELVLELMGKINIMHNDIYEASKSEGTVRLHNASGIHPSIIIGHHLESLTA